MALIIAPNGASVKPLGLVLGPGMWGNTGVRDKTVAVVVATQNQTIHQLYQSRNSGFPESALC
jgi:hypothetical protein